MMPKIFRSLVCVIAVFALVATPAWAQNWGDLTLTFTYEGTPPSPSPLSITKDQAFCGQFNLVNEELLVNRENGGIQNIIAYLYLSRGDKQPDVHPSYAEAAKETVVVDNLKCRFAPHVQLLQAGQPLIVKNSDTVGHNTNFTTLSNPPQNILIPAGGDLKIDFKVAERLPSKIACNIHPWMTGWLVIRDNPYMGLTDENGKLTIKNLPAGKWTFQFWHEQSGYVAEAKQNGKRVAWRRGRAELDIKPGANDLGEFKLSPKLFQK